VASGSESSSSDGESGYKQLRAPTPRLEYESVQDLMSTLVPFHSFGAVLSLLGFGLVVSTLLS
jgi:hypothetical protein